MALIKRSFLEARPTEVGKIKIGTRGQPRKNSSGGVSFLPEKLDHFLVTTMERDGKDGPFMRDDHVHGMVGDQPRELNGTLMYPEVEDNLHTEMAVYKGRRRQWSCNGEQRVLRDGKMEPCQREASRPCECKPYSRLIIQLDAQPAMGGYYVFRSHGWASTNNLQTSLEDIYREFGTLYRAPVKLFMQRTEDTYVVNGEEKTGSSWKVGLVLRMSPMEARAYLAQQAREAIATREQLRLEASNVVGYLNAADVESEAEMADEFRPPHGVAASVATQEALEGVVARLEKEEAVEADYEVEEEAEPEPEPEVLTKAQELDNLFAAAAEIGLAFTDEQVARCREGIAGSEQLQDQTLAWVKRRLTDHQQGGAS